MKILLGIDESAHSERAVEFVARLRWPAGSRVLVLGALKPAVDLAASDLGGAPAVARLVEDGGPRLEEVVGRAAESLREAGMATESRVVVGDPREVLVEVAQGEHADLLVVGSRGNTGLARLMLGSVSSHVVAHAPCSVLVVKKDRFTAVLGKEKAS